MTYLRCVLAILAYSAAAIAQAADRPVLVELFTSQGCSSCPPAEEFLIHLAQQYPSVLALGFHVDYWDRLGWKDPFSSAAATQRQRHYQGMLGSDHIYTPQMVVDGTRDVLGSDRGAALSAVGAAVSRVEQSVPLRLVRSGTSLSMNLGSGRGVGRVLLVGFDARKETVVLRGENAGRTITQANVVRSFEAVSDWHGREISLTRPMPLGELAALILQREDGRILGVALLGN